MAQAPVYYVLAQVQFNPVAAMAKYVDEIQDSLRRQGYPLFEPRQAAHLQITVMPGQVPAPPQIMQTVSWLISNADRTAGFVLTPSSLAFHTTHYETHREFIPELLRGLQAVHEVVGLDHVARLGLRYLDAVLPRQNETVDRYLADGLHGVRFSAEQQYALNESVFKTQSGPLVEHGLLIARVSRHNGILEYPPDIDPQGLVQMSRFALKEARPHAVIDTDHFVQGRMPLDLDKLKQQLLNLHATIRQVFEAAINPGARAAWS